MAGPRLPALSAQEVARIRGQAEQRLRSRGLFRESSADRWGVTLDVGPLGNVTLSGLLRDMDLHDEAVRLVREVPGVQGVAGDVKVSEHSAPGESVGAREQIQQKLRSRGLLRESSADRWGVTVEVSVEGDIKLAGTLRDTGLQREAIRLAQEVAGVQQVTNEIRVMERLDRQ
jgi:osmotically-inducible protein OsmY